MKVFGIISVILGICGIGAGMMMFGDIGIACIVGGLAALLAGIALVKGAKKIKQLEEKVDSLSQAVFNTKAGG